MENCANRWQQIVGHFTRSSESTNHSLVVRYLCFKNRKWAEAAYRRRAGWVCRDSSLWEYWHQVSSSQPLWASKYEGARLRSIARLSLPDRLTAERGWRSECLSPTRPLPPHILTDSIFAGHDILQLSLSSSAIGVCQWQWIFSIDTTDITTAWLNPLHRQITALPPPYGTCQMENILEHFDNYSVAACRMECEMKATTAACGCRMVHHAGPQKVCSVDEMSCAEQAVGKRICHWFHFLSQIRTCFMFVIHLTDGNRECAAR